jgi:hypothetical protein
MATRSDLEQALDALEAKIPQLQTEYADDAEFWCAFAGEADHIEDSAGADDCDYVSQRIDAMVAAVAKSRQE